ncbi:mitochondrial protein C2orf69 homolog [Parasteatoda tepidariorum]|uniref:mitochondrial protein C2orf69 homolog n=1 Tax=Parasteatoda tepidariorum TaxID=114398 RepID=UPI00077FB330
MEVAKKVSGPHRLGVVEGYQGRKNEIVLHPPHENSTIIGTVVYFGGDMQDYKENMLAHRDNKYYSDWDLETTATILNRHFPDYVVLIIKPSKMALKTFSCYDNFMTTNNFGAPSYSSDLDSLKHLNLLLHNVESVCVSNFNLSEFICKPVTLIGFSKGCVVLNQFLYSIHFLRNSPDEEMELLLKKINCFYWIDGGHSGTSPTWITDKSVLESFSKLDVDVHLHVTPYQVLCDTRPRIGKEEKLFRESLIKLGMNVKRKLHFSGEPRSLENHFKVLHCFHEKE